MYLGIDVSTYLEQQRIAHSKYKKDGKEIDPFALFKNNGVSLFRTRIWNNPYSEDGEPYLGGTCDLNNCIELAKLVSPYGFRHIIDFHYSDFWVDPSKQYPPKEWQKLSYHEVEEKVYNFTKDSLLEIKAAQIDVAMVQVGNEITQGILWPFGKLLYGPERQESFDRYAGLIKSGIKATKEVFPDAEIIIHLEESYNQELYRDIVSNLLARGVKFDILGTSYYPFWHHGFDEYFANLDMIRKEFNLKVMNVEVGYPFTLEDYKQGDGKGSKQLVINVDSIANSVQYLPHYPSRDGQAKFIEEFIKLAKKHNLYGVCYWEPLWIPGEGICWASKPGQVYQNDIKNDTRNEWANLCLFDYEGNALPAVDKYKL